jgi:hypothetical protein
VYLGGKVLQREYIIDEVEIWKEEKKTLWRILEQKMIGTLSSSCDMAESNTLDFNLWFLLPQNYLVYTFNTCFINF